MITLTQFSNLEFKENINIVYPIMNMDEIMVKYISILEPPVEQFVRENEIILSSALSVRNDENELKQFIYEIYKAKAAAIILAFPNNDYTLLEPILEYFQKLNFPILTMSWTHLFSDIVENTLKEIWKIENRTKILLESTQKELLNSYILGNSLNTACETIYSFFTSNSIIFDINHNLKGSNVNFGEDFSVENINANDYIILKIISSSKFYGYLYLKHSDKLKQITQNNIELFIITPLILWFEKEWTSLQSNIKTTNSFVKKLTTGSFLTQEECLIKAEFLKINTKCNYLTIVGVPIEMEKFENKSWISSDIRKNISTLFINTIVERILFSANQLNSFVMQCFEDNSFIIYLQEKVNENHIEKITNFLDTLDFNIKNVLPQVAMLWGYENHSTSFANLSNSCQNAKEALHICEISNGSISRNSHELSIKHLFLSTLKKDEQILKSAQKTLAPLINYDIQKNNNLIETLAVYCKNNYNITETAQSLNLHRQSLIYRISKIEQLLNLSLKNHSDLFILELCILIKD